MDVDLCSFSVAELINFYDCEEKTLERVVQLWRLFLLASMAMRSPRN